MKYLNDYTSGPQTKLFKDTGAFFAFSKKQYEEQSVVGVQYIPVGAGLLVPKQNAVRLLAGLESIQKQSIAEDIAENGVEAIIHRELGNYETQLTGDLSEVIAALSDYPIGVEAIQHAYPKYYQECIDNDWF